MIIIFPNFKEHTILPGNEYLEIHYTGVTANSVWENDSMEWEAWQATEPFIPPQTNPLLTTVYSAGGPLELHEHACICVEGSSIHKFTTSTGGVVEYNWNLGVHNVENGYGYKPTLGFRREFPEDFTICCVGSKETRTDWSKKHRFSILTESTTLANGASFVHTAIGAFTVNGERYEARGTAFDLAADSVLTLDSGSAIIVCEKVNY